MKAYRIIFNLITFVILFSFFSCNLYATMFTISDDVVYDDQSELYYYRNLGCFEGLTYSGILDGISNLAENNSYNWRIATRGEAESIYHLNSGFYNDLPLWFYYEHIGERSTTWVGITQLVGVDPNPMGVLGYTNNTEVHFDDQCEFTKDELVVQGWTLWGDNGDETTIFSDTVITGMGAWIVADEYFPVIAPVPEPVSIFMFIMGFANLFIFKFDQKLFFKRQ